jgi:hypothetical protein
MISELSVRKTSPISGVEEQQTTVRDRDTLYIGIANIAYLSVWLHTKVAALDICSLRRVPCTLAARSSRPLINTSHPRR